MTPFDALRTYVRKAHFEDGKWIEGMRLEIYADDDPLDPRKEWDNFGHMVCAHRQYQLGDEQLDTSGFSSWDEVADYLEAERGAVIILPLYLFDHSGLSISVGSSHFRMCDPQGWDWGQVGFIYATMDDVTKEYGDTMPESIRKAEELLCTEVDTYDKYLTGEVYGFKLFSDVEIDSCWGFYDIDDILDETGMTKEEEV